MKRGMTEERKRGMHFQSFACEIDWHLDQILELGGGIKTGPQSCGCVCGDSSSPV